MIKNRIAVSICLVLCLTLIGGCGNHGRKSENGTFIYYVDMDESSLVKEEYEMQEESAESLVSKMLDKMMETTDSIDYKSVFPGDVKVEDWSLDDEKLDLFFNQAYQDMSGSEEVLLRAAVVQTLCQIPEVSCVMFYIQEEPLKDSEGKQIGYMRPDDFIQNTGSAIHSYQKKKIELYFGNKKGDMLIEEEVNIRYNSSTSIEKAIVEQLIQGPDSSGVYPVISPETKVIGVSVKDGICYVNLDENFLNNFYGTDPKIIVYSIVNSVVEGGNANRVQISVNGESDIQYMDRVDLSKPLARDLDLVEDN